MKKTLPLKDLADRHPGLTKSIGDGYCEAASVCFSRHHEAPVDLTLKLDAIELTCLAVWDSPSPRTQNAWANETDTTEAGAYGVSLAAVELLKGMVAMRRAETLTGADYYIAPAGSETDDLEGFLRLEVSGIDHGTRGAIATRLLEKKAQLRKGAGNLPALASVVGFKERAVALATVEDDK